MIDSYVVRGGVECSGRQINEFQGISPGHHHDWHATAMEQPLNFHNQQTLTTRKQHSLYGGYGGYGGYLWTFIPRRDNSSPVQICGASDNSVDSGVVKSKQVGDCQVNRCLAER